MAYDRMYDLGVPVGEMDEVWEHATSASYCYAESANRMYVCTLAPGHSGMHVAHLTTGMVVGRWGLPVELQVKAGL